MTSGDVAVAVARVAQLGNRPRVMKGGAVTDTYRVLTVEDDPDPTTYLRLALLRTTWHTEHPVRCPASVRAVLRAVTSTTHAGTSDPVGGATCGPARPITLILDGDPRWKVRTHGDIKPSGPKSTSRTCQNVL